MSSSPEIAEAAPLPDDVATLKALLLAERATAAKLAGQNEHLRALVKELQRALFGRRSEKTTHPDQLQLALEDLEQAIAEGAAEVEKIDRVQRAERRQQRRVNRGALPKHLPREEIVIEPGDGCAEAPRHAQPYDQGVCKQGRGSRRNHDGDERLVLGYRCRAKGRSPGARSAARCS